MARSRYRVVQIPGVPANDRGDEEVQTGGAMPQVLKGAIMISPGTRQQGML